MMRVAVSLSTALILIVFGLLWLFLMALGAYGYDTSNGLAALIGGGVLMIMSIVIASLMSGWLAHVLQTRSGLSPWLVGPGTVVAVTAVAMIVMFVGGTIVTSVIDAALRPAPRQPHAVNRRY